jgi:hypothetical protein
MPETGRIIPTAPAMYSAPIQKLEGSPLEVASSNTIKGFQSQAAAARSLGAGQKGASRRRKRGGAALNLNAHIPDLPESGTIKGVSHAQNHLDAVNHLNQIRADKVGDSLINSQPILLGGKKHGRSRKRTHRRKRRRTTHRRRRSSRTV